MERIVHIVPSLPPRAEGVGSFASLLAGALQAEHGIESRFLVASPSWAAPAPDERPAPAARPLPERSAALLHAALREATASPDATTAVLLHYANYAYETRGCPAWLIEGLSRWKEGSGARLGTVFHEVHAFGPPWRSSFWLLPRQRSLAAALARLSDGLVTSMQYYRRILRRWVPGREIGVLPVFSNMGEPQQPPPLSRRAPRLIVFGGAGTRALAYRELTPALELACRKLGIAEVLDVGPGGESAAPRLPVPWRRLGPLPEGEVSHLLASSTAGFVAYPAPFLAKSGIFAAYSAHRILPVCAWHRPRLQREEPPPRWIPAPNADASPEALQQVADRAQDWYLGHTLSRHAAYHRRMLFPR